MIQSGEDAMKETMEELERWGADVIFGRARGVWASVMRCILHVLSWLFRGVVWLRLWSYRSGWRPSCRLGCKVVAIGNVTLGGTGKTPVVELLSKSLRDSGRTVAILSRGYKSEKLEVAQEWQGKDGKRVRAEWMPKVVSTGDELLLDSRYAGDEPYMLAKNLKGVSVLVDKKREKSARFAIRELGADTLLLDDGMQYLNLEHSMDIILVDSSSPFGTEHLLPRGTLREPPRNLKRAGYILLTKCTGESNAGLIERIRRYNKTAEIIECTHGPVYLENVFTQERLPLESLKDRWVGAISAIAVPEAFEGSLAKLGAKVEIRRRFADHFRFSQKDVDAFMHRCVERDMEMILTTEKDAVRFPRPSSIDVPIYFLRIEVKILQGQEIWDDLIKRLAHPEPAMESILRYFDRYDDE